MINSAQGSSNGLYIHVPFCHRKCFYCSFVVSVGHDAKVDPYLECLEKEAAGYRDQSVDFVYLGGGTPTYLSAAQLDRLCKMIRSVFVLPEKGCEWTIECNPESLSAEKVDVLAGNGVNRFSVGVQSFHDKYLRYLGRNHDASAAEAAIRSLRGQGAKNVSLDLMFGFPDQTLFELKEDIDRIVSLDCQHVSLYSLTIEEKTRFHSRGVRLPDQDVQADFYRTVMEELARAGFEQYEISNFARRGFESRHNINYWMSGNYVGLGVGAHSHCDGTRWWNLDNVFEYIKNVGDGQSVIQGREYLDDAQRLREAIVFGLRMNTGIDLSALEKRFGVELDEQRRSDLERFVREGFLVRQDNRIQTTSRGRMLLDELASYLV